ncbi:hypothetical protein [Kordia sp.]|uniref:hypothetical protein n=1 Tax=Kordia sp. TaxID=1965332 RepID=UPI003D6B4F4D
MKNRKGMPIRLKKTNIANLNHIKGRGDGEGNNIGDNTNEVDCPTTITPRTGSLLEHTDKCE